MLLNGWCWHGTGFNVSAVGVGVDSSGRMKLGDVTGGRQNFARSGAPANRMAVADWRWNYGFIDCKAITIRLSAGMKST